MPFVLLEDEEETEDVKPKSKAKFKLVEEPANVYKDISKQVSKKLSAGAAGSYGDLLDLVGAQTKERTAPGQQSLYEAEFNAPESQLGFLQDEDILPRFQRIPSQKEAESFIQMLGGPGEAETPQGRIAGRSAELLGALLPFGATPTMGALAALSGIAGQGLRETGVSEGLATGIELGINLAPVAKSIPKILQKKTITKPSGLTERKFEGLQKPTKVSSSTLSKTTEAIEQEYRSIVSDLLKDSNKSYSALVEDPTFKSKISNLFGKVAESAKKTTQPILPNKLINTVNKELDKVGTKGLTFSDTEKVKHNELRKIMKSLDRESVTAEQLLDQYRKNNESLSKIFPYGENAAQNAGKREALEAYNRSIADAIEDSFGNTEFGELFKFTNKRWNEIKKIETVDTFVDALFKGDKIKFSQAEKAIGDTKKSSVLKNALGKEAFNDFKQLNQDLLSQQNAYKLLKSKGYDLDNLSKAAVGYILKPSIAKGKVGLDFVRNLYRRTLANPKKVHDWKKGLENIRKGKVQEGIAILNSIKEED